MPTQNPTTNYNLILPTVGASADAWGTILNALLGDDVTGIDAIIKTVDTNAKNASNLSSGTVPTARLTGGYTGITAVGTLASLVVSGAVVIGAGSPLRLDGNPAGDTYINESVANQIHVTAGGVTTVLFANTIFRPLSDNAIALGSATERWSAVHAVAFNGSGAGLTALPAAQLTGTIADARVPATAVTQHQAALSIAATQLTGTIASARLSGSYTGITAVGTITSLRTSGNVGVGVVPDANTALDVQKSVAAGNLYVAHIRNISTTAGLSRGLFIRAGVDVTDLVLNINNAANTLSLFQVLGDGSANALGSFTAASFSGSGSGLTSLPAGQITGTVPNAAIAGAYNGFTSIIASGNVTAAAYFVS